MPAAPVPNPPWATGSWSDTAWEEGSWGEGADPGTATGSRFRYGYRYAWAGLIALFFEWGF